MRPAGPGRAGSARAGRPPRRPASRRRPAGRAGRARRRRRSRHRCPSRRPGPGCPASPAGPARPGTGAARSAPVRRRPAGPAPASRPRRSRPGPARPAARRRRSRRAGPGTTTWRRSCRSSSSAPSRTGQPASTSQSGATGRHSCRILPGCSSISGIVDAALSGGQRPQRGRGDVRAPRQQLPREDQRVAAEQGVEAARVAVLDRQRRRVEPSPRRRATRSRPLQLGGEGPAHLVHPSILRARPPPAAWRSSTGRETRARRVPPADAGRRRWAGPANRRSHHVRIRRNPPAAPAAGTDVPAARTALATVCISGTLEDKLAAAAAAGFDGVEIFEPDLVASPLSPAQLRARCAELGLSIDLYQPFRDFDAAEPGPAGREPAPGRAQVRHHAAELGTDLILVCSSVSPDALDDDDGIAEQLHTLASRAAERGPAGVLRGAGLGPVRQHLRAVLGDRAPGRPPGAGPVRGQLPHPVPRLRPGRHPGHPRREAVLPAARRRPAHGHGRPAVEPAPPAVPRPGRVGPAGVPGPRAHRRLHRAAVARGVQRRVPAVRPAPVRGGRAALAAGAAGGDRWPGWTSRPGSGSR